MAPRERRGTFGHGSGGSPTPGRGATHSPRTPRRRSTSPRCGCREASRSRSTPSARVARCTVSRTRPGSSSRGRAPRRRAGTSRRRTRGWRSTASCADARPPACSSPTRTRAARSTAAATPSWRRWSCASGCARSPARGGGRTRPSPRPPPASSSAARASSRTSPIAWSPNRWTKRARAGGRAQPKVKRAARRESRPGPRFRREDPYRELLQLGRDLRGEPSLLAQEEEMADRKRVEGTPERIALPPAASVPARLESMSNKELLQHIMQNAVLLAKKEVELAKAELKADLKKEVAMAKGLGVAGLCAIWSVSMMLVAGAMALGTALPEWAAALIVAAAVLLVGWGKRVTEPLEMTRRTLKEDVQWAKERIA